MVIKEDAEVLKAMKAAKTGEEMVLSWMSQAPGRDKKKDLESLRLFIEKKPEMIQAYAHNQLTQITDRGILDRKTRYLVIIGIYISQRHWRGLLPQCCNARAAGATDEEILEVAFLANYGASKTWLVEQAEALAEVFENPTFQAIKKR
jgi:alkylhydroperoxidase/carboxymuconolactone decarboxylase family protein YurZ